MDKEKDNDISELNIPEIERYLDLDIHKKEIIDHIWIRYSKTRLKQ